MPANKNSNSTKPLSSDKPKKISALRSGQSNALPADTTSDLQPARTAATATASDAPIFREWRLERLADIATVAPDQTDKMLYFLTHAIRKCRIQNRTLLSMTYHEQGRIKLEMRDNETGELIREPREASPEELQAQADAADEDPLS